MYISYAHAHTHCRTSVCLNPLLPTRTSIQPSSAPLTSHAPNTLPVLKGYPQGLTLIPHPPLASPPPRGGEAQGLFSSDTRKSKMAKQ